MNANLIAMKIEMTQNEAKAAGKIGTEKSNELKQYMDMYPTFTIEVKMPAKRKTEFKGLDYKYMKNYIQKSTRNDKTTIMEEFNILIAQDKKDKKEGAEYMEAASYMDVKKWFLAKFPEVKKAHDTHKKKVQEIMTNAAAK